MAGSAALAQACADLLVKTGHTDKANNGLVGVWSRANDQGAWDLGFRPMENLAAAMEKAQVLYIVGADPAADDENFKALLQKRYDTPDNLTIVQDINKTETATLADVILAAQAQVEREGTFTSGERRVQRFYPATTPKGESLPDFEIVARIGAKLGIELKGRFPSIVFPQLAKETAGYEGLSYQKLAEVTEQWPIIGRDDLYYGGTGYKNDQGLGVQLHPSGWRSSCGSASTCNARCGPRCRSRDIPLRLWDHGGVRQKYFIPAPRSLS